MSFTEDQITKFREAFERCYGDPSTHKFRTPILKETKMTQLNLTRYANRKLYDRDQSQYVSLEAVETAVVAGLEVRVTDNKTKADITDSVLKAVIALRTPLSRDKMVALIRTGGNA